MDNVNAVPLVVKASTGRGGLTLRARDDSTTNSWRRPLTQSDIAPGDEVVIIRQSDFDSLMLPRRLVEKHNTTVRQRRSARKVAPKAAPRAKAKSSSRSKRGSRR